MSPSRGTLRLPAAEDLGKHLDVTLDSILRAIAHLRRKR
jgi:hypothetical protein